MKMTKACVVSLTGLIVALSGVNCIIDVITAAQREASLKRFDSAEELRAYLVEQATEGQNRSDGGGILFSDGFAEEDFDASPLGSPTADTDDAADGDYSTTNVQELGVDESDIVKNDSDTIFVLDNNTVRIVQATPAEGVTELASLDIAESGDSLYLYGDTLVALSRQYIYYTYWDTTESAAVEATNGSIMPYHDGVETTVTIIDVSDPAHPQVDTTLTFEGRLVSSRMIEDRLYVVMTTTPRLPLDPTPAALEAMTLDDWLPDYTREDADGGSETGDIADWQDYYRPGSPDGYGMTTVVTVDVDDPDTKFASTAISADAGLLYASTEALYVTDTDYAWDTFSSRTDTILHKLAFSDTGTDYVASGLVQGRVLNQYSLGEHEDYLRVATTNDEWTSAGGSLDNNIYVLGESGTSLEVVGKIENIAPGEEIYSARFLGDRGFLVTFRRVDPLFAIDLSDPTNPEIVGELKVPGYSDHIQMLDENHLLTIGKDAEDAGTFAWIQGVQLSIFDVTNMTKPTLLHKEVIGGRGTNSEANYNPKAFNYFASRGLLAFPIDYYSSGTTDSQYGQYQHTGLYVYGVDADSDFDFLGYIPTTDGVTEDGCFVSYYGFTRGVFIGENVYAVTNNGVKAASTNDLETILSEAEFEGEDSTYTNCWFVEDMIVDTFGEGIR